MVSSLRVKGMNSDATWYLAYRDKGNEFFIHIVKALGTVLKFIKN